MEICTYRGPYLIRWSDRDLHSSTSIKVVGSHGQECTSYYVQTTFPDSLHTKFYPTAGAISTCIRGDTIIPVLYQITSYSRATMAKSMRRHLGKGPMRRGIPSYPVAACCAYCVYCVYYVYCVYCVLLR